MVRLVTLAARMVAIGLTLLQLYSVISSPLPLHLHFILFLSGMMLLVFADKLDEASIAQRIVSLVFLAGIVASGLYLALNVERYITRIAFVDDVLAYDKIFGAIFILCLLEATRRAAGLGLLVIAVVFILYGFFGNILPAGLGHSGLSLERFIDIQILSNNGIFGIPTGAVVSYIFYFIVFATFLEISGGGKLFIDLAFAATGRTRGGPAKAAVVASGVMGSINGSAVANVVGTGTFTIPLMLRGGYKPAFAGAVEAASSTGGQLMPPIMGAAAFVMVELTGLSYVTILIGAAVPALLYYLSILFAVDLTAKKENLRGLSADEMPDVRRGLLQRIHLLIPLVVLVYFLVTGWSLMMAAIYSLCAILLCSLLRKETRISPSLILLGLERSARGVIMVAIPCATAGLIIGIIIQTGIGIHFTNFILSIASGSMLLCLLAVMFACIILGMGMPTVAAYIMVAALMAPSLVGLHINILAAHLFIFYFALLSFVTPPVALAAYAAAALAKTNAMKTGLQAFRLTLPGFIIPFAFVYNPALVMQGTWLESIWVTVTCGIGVYALASSMVGMGLRESTFVERLAGIAAAILLISPERISDAIGIAIFLGVFGFQWFRGRQTTTSLAVRSDSYGQH